MRIADAQGRHSGGVQEPRVISRDEAKTHTSKLFSPSCNTFTYSSLFAHPPCLAIRSPAELGSNEKRLADLGNATFSLLLGIGEAGEI